MPCSACKRDVEIVAKGFCEACYRRQLKHGTTEYLRLGKRTYCHIKGCTDRAVSHGLCDKHRQRLKDHGHTDLKRDSWGALWKHPLRHSWMWLRRHQSQTEMCREWRNDFLQFVADVGERPDPKAKLYVADDSKPIGPGNFVWKRAITQRVEGEDERTYAARRQRVYRGVHQEAAKGYGLKRSYGLNLSEYAALQIKHKFVCGICGAGEKSVIRGKKVSLSVDHDHKTGLVRGLLCSNHNRGLGLFNDDPALLHSAIAYLKNHTG